MSMSGGGTWDVRVFASNQDGYGGPFSAVHTFAVPAGCEWLSADCLLMPLSVSA